MKTTVRKVGNSRGVLLPAAVLAVCDIGDEVELSVQDGRIVIAPIKAPRDGWFDDYLAADDEDAWGELGATDADSADWEW
ncbi:MAG: AbrB/MazE/SpoVT family DNA-binding domain-containing protein [Gammaproteobacteria bacterium]|nr:AbrB/MazE/SpoVT family DNA-binding domain-containing protein [Gammaproteobacteria bacterium]